MAKLPDEVDMLKYVNALLERKVAVVPGSAFMTDDTAPCSYIRLNFSTPSDDDIVKCKNHGRSCPAVQKII